MLFALTCPTNWQSFKKFGIFGSAKFYPNERMTSGILFHESSNVLDFPILS